MAVQRALLLIADIGGYTRFMKVHRVNLAHAQDIVARLLEAVIDAARPQLKLSKLEGDAALFYAPYDTADARKRAGLAERIASIHAAFAQRRQELVDARMCNCDSCLQAGQLKLKFVTHLGEIAFQKVHRLIELAGMDVILVHRLLKNNVPLPEYVLMTEPVLEELDPGLRPHATAQEEELEGIGATRTFYVDVVRIAPALPAPRPRPLWRRLWELIKMNVRVLPFVSGVKQSCQLFRNMQEATGGLLAPPAPAALPQAPGAGRTSA